VICNQHITSYSKGRKTLGLRSFVANFSQAFKRPLVRRYMPMIVSIEELEDRWKESNKLMALLPLLEYSYPEVLQDIKGSDFITEDVLVSMVEYSLRFPSRHWALSAVKWMESGFTINRAICENLIAISKDKSDSQKLRHKSIAQANKWQREKGI
jgi:hypothetical protein